MRGNENIIEAIVIRSRSQAGGTQRAGPMSTKRPWPTTRRPLSPDAEAARRRPSATPGSLCQPPDPRLEPCSSRRLVSSWGMRARVAVVRRRWGNGRAPAHHRYRAPKRGQSTSNAFVQRAARGNKGAAGPAGGPTRLGTEPEGIQPVEPVVARRTRGKLAIRRHYAGPVVCLSRKISSGSRLFSCGPLGAAAEGANHTARVQATSFCALAAAPR